MAKEIKLAAQLREEGGGRAKQVRAGGFIPAVLYGPGADTINLKIIKSGFEKIYAAIGETGLVDLSIGEKEAVRALIKDVQRDPVKGGILQVDFYRVDMNKPIEVDIPLNFVGESGVVKELGGTLVKNKNVIEVSCLPGDLVDGIDVDLAALKTFDDVIRVGDIELPPNFILRSHPEDVVVNAREQKMEEEKKEEAAGEAGAEEEKEGGGESEKAAEAAGEKKNDEKNE